MRCVLLLGLDPHATPGVDAAMVDMAIAIGNKRFAEAGIEADVCLIKPGEDAAPVIEQQLKRKAYGCVVIGGGLRKPDEMVELLERTIELIRLHAPQAAIAFNTNPMTSLDAALRWVDHKSSPTTGG